ncbi:MAG: Gfo/Idh/MocA family oxidoreductase [Treponema sp.]|jgi:predicted dehydrogenase|nr:Gfo/Idh/MocA family oxidoreductase [Treponema sp.]
MKKLKIGIIGVGNISTFHIEGYQKNPHVELAALCDISEDRLHYMGNKYGVTHCFTSAQEMLARLPELDAVSVCTWNSEHAPITIAALNAGKHVLCEKPMATTAAAAREMLAAAEKNNKLLMIGFVRRFGNDCRILKEFIDQDSLGEIYYTKASYLRRNGNPGGWFGDKSRSGGGPLIDLGVHVIDLSRYLMGNRRPVSIYGAAFQKLFDRPHIKTAKNYTASSVQGEKQDICDVEDLAVAMIRFDNGAVLQVEAAFSLNIKQNEGILQFFGTKGGAKLSPELELYTEINGYLADVNLAAPTALSFNGLFEAEIDHFVDCLLKGTPCRTPAQDGVEIMRILEGIYESARLGREVIL